MRYSILVCIAFFSVASSLVAAQSRLPRVDYATAVAKYGQGLPTSIRTVRIDASGVLKNVHNVFTPTGVSNPGGLELFLSDEDGVSKYENVLVCGLNSNGQGVVEHWKRETSLKGGYQLQGTPAIPEGQHDFIGVVFLDAASKIYLLDRLSNSIYENSWNGCAQIPTSGWVVWANSSLVTELATASKYTLGINPNCNPPKLALYPFKGWGGIPTPISMWYDPLLGFIVERAECPTTRLVEILPYSMSEGSSSLIVRGSPGINVEVVDVSDCAVIGSATIPENNKLVTVSLSRALGIGLGYFARQSGVATDQGLFVVKCPIRYGHSEALSSGNAMASMCLPLNNKVGECVSYYLATYASVDPPQIGMVESLVGYMAIALRDQQGQDPVLQVGDNWLLNAIYYINVTGSIYFPNGHIFGRIQIPDDPNLVGAVLLAQFWIQDGETYRLSQIIGAKIEGGGALKVPSGGEKTALSLDKFNLKTGANKIIEEILKQRTKTK